MKIISIEFNNYRCFKKAKFDFDNKGLNIIIGKNGSGKTELLYAIEWVLYGLDFSQLKGKTANPYSLNSDLYKNYTNPSYEIVNEASVTMVFTHPVIKKRNDGSEENVETKFWLKKSEIYNPNGKSTPNQSIHSKLSIYDENGSKLPPIEDEECEKRIKKIIPKKILSGLLFDGERMKALSNDDENSRNTIDGFISEITNVEQMMYSKNLIESIKKEYSRDKTKLLKNLGYTNEATENEEILRNEDSIKSYEEKRKKLKISLTECENKLNVIKAELQSYEEIKTEVIKRDSAQIEKTKLLKTYQRKLDGFQSELDQGYLLWCDDLFSQVTDLIDNNDVPVGLTADAVRNILNMKTCICGEPWTEQSKKNVMDLIEKLPPENLNSSISQTIGSIKRYICQKRTSLKNAYKEIGEYNLSLADIDKRIAESSKIIGSSNIEAIRDKENEKNRLDNELVNIKADLLYSQERIKELQNENKRKFESIERYVESSRDINLINQKYNYVSKCIDVIDKYIELSKKESLDIINKLISESYEKISEEYDLGKRIYITQFIEPKYKIVTYFVDKFNSVMKEANMPRLFNEFGLDLSELNNEEKKKEVAILKAAENSSTGQRKIVTLSFVKAVMEFAMAKDNSLDFRTKREYPLFIDAPFSELSGDNLSKFAKELPNFNEQSIVMLDPDVYDDIKTYFEEHISKEYIISKNKGSNDTKLEEAI